MRILFLGAPGAGKGTQCKKLSERLMVPHLSSGDLLREAVKNRTEAGVAAQEYMDKGHLVPDDVLIKMFKERLNQCGKGFILDGFPRNLVQAQALDRLLEEIKQPLDSVINLQIKPKLLTDRIVGRRTCENKACGAVYHVTFSPPLKEMVCDRCGASLGQRSDDKEELVESRLAVYTQQTEPLIDYYDKRLLLRTVDGQGDQEAIFADILRTLEAAVPQ